MCYFPLLVLKGIYHYWTYFIFSRGLKQMEVLGSSLSWWFLRPVGPFHLARDGHSTCPSSHGARAFGRYRQVGRSWPLLMMLSQAGCAFREKKEWSKCLLFSNAEGSLHSAQGFQSGSPRDCGGRLSFLFVFGPKFMIQFVGYGREAETRSGCVSTRCGRSFGEMTSQESICPYVRFPVQPALFGLALFHQLAR